MMTDYDLLNLRNLAMQAKPFDGEKLPDPKRSRANGEFFKAAHRAVPDLIDEVLKLRRQVGELKQAAIAPEGDKAYQVGETVWFKYSSPPVPPQKQYVIGTKVTMVDRESGRLVAQYRVLSTDERDIEGVVTDVYAR